MKSKKKPLVAAAMSALLALASSPSAQATGGSTDKHPGRKVHRRVEKKGAKYRRGRLESGKKATKTFRPRRGGRKGKKSSGGTTTPPPK